MRNIKRKMRLKSPLQNEGLIFLLKNFEKRKQRNNRYSLRAYSRDLEVDCSLLSKILNGKVVPSQEFLKKCLMKLGASDSFIERSIKEITPNKNWEKVCDDEFEVIADWTHFCILELMLIPGFKLSVESVTKILPLTEADVEDKISRLQKLGYIKYVSSSYVLEEAFTTSYSSKKTTKARILNQERLMSKSLSSLQNESFDIRDHSSVMLALNADDMPRLKIWIGEARRQLTKLFQTDSQFTNIYCLQVGLFPLTKRLDGNE